MTIEEKAKAYDEVLERVKPLYEWAKKDDSPMKPVVTHGETYHVDTLGTQQVIAGKMPQKPAEWSDEDEILRVRTINRLETLNFHGISGKEIRESIDWLKSLRPQSYWKPSDGQPDIFDTAAFQKGVQEGRRLEKEDKQ